MKFWLNLILFQLGWFASVLGAAKGLPWLGPVFTALWMVYHLRSLGNLRRAEIRLLLVAALLGWISDSLILSTGWIEFPARTQFGLWSPLWMVALWVNLAATLRGAMAWLQGRYILSALLGAAAGPMAYWSGSRLGAMNLLNAEAALFAIAIEWGLAMPLLLVLERWSRTPGVSLPTGDNNSQDRSQQ